MPACIYSNMCIGDRIDMLIDMLIDMHIGICTGMRIDMCLDMCIGMYMGMYSGALKMTASARAFSRHVARGQDMSTRIKNVYAHVYLMASPRCRFEHLVSFAPERVPQAMTI